MKQVSRKCLTNSIPSKWLKFGLSSLVISIIMKNNVFAYNQSEKNMPTAGVVTQTRHILPSRIGIISILIFIIIGLSILITKIKSKKQNETKEIKKWVKVIFIISIILFIISILIMNRA